MKRRGFLQLVASALLAPALVGFRLPEPDLDPFDQLTVAWLEWSGEISWTRNEILRETPTDYFVRRMMPCDRISRTGCPGS